MKIDETLVSLDNSWSREDVLYKLKNGQNSEKIINEFFDKNKEDIKKLSKYFLPKDKELLKHLEELSTCEAKLINKIINLNTSKSNFKSKEYRMVNIQISKENFTQKLGSFMLKWSNKFIVITLLTISALALSKQAWA